MYWSLLWRYFMGYGELLRASTLFSIAGVSLGVMCLVLAMSAFSGFETTLKRAITDRQGHMMIYSRGAPMNRPEAVERILWDTSTEIEAAVGFAALEGLVAHQEKVGFVVLTGLPWPGFETVLNLESNIVEGHLSSDELAPAVVGKGVATTYELAVGDSFPFVWPQPKGREPGRLAPVMTRLKVAAIADFGTYDLNERSVITRRQVVQDLAQMGERFSGFYVRLTDPDLAPELTPHLAAALGPGFWVSDWKAQNRNLLSAIEIEKLAIFFILQIIMVVACVNVAISLSTMVLRRYSDIAVLKALGLRARQVQRVFAGYGLLVCGAGLVAGLLLGIAGTFLLEWAQVRWNLLPGDIYRLDHIQLEIRPWDLAAISVATLLIGVLSTWIPARRGAALEPTEGFRYE